MGGEGNIPDMALEEAGHWQPTNLDGQELWASEYCYQTGLIRRWVVHFD
jgi:hypothetical protein